MPQSEEFIHNIHIVVVHGNTNTETLLVTSDRMVYALGCKEDGCHGSGHTWFSLTSRKIDILCDKNIKYFVYGSSHVLALTEDGKVYSWGNNRYFQLGNKSDNTNFNATPTLVQENLSHTFVVDVACGRYHSLALTGDGQVYEWGLIDYTESCRSWISYGYRTIAYLPYKGCSLCMAPTKVSFPLCGKRIVCISCGDFFSMIVTADGEVYGWGDNRFRQLGIGYCISRRYPSKIPKLTGFVIEKVVCGSVHTLALSKEGILFTWGANNDGPVQVEMPLVARILDMAASHYNDISVPKGEGNRVFVWGQCLEQSVRIPTLIPHRYLYDALTCYAIHDDMHKPFLFDVNGKPNLTDCMERAFNDPTTSDLAIRVEGSLIHVHKALLKIRCQYFRIMFQKHWAENNQSVIEHEEFSYNVYRAFLEYLYTDQINVPVEDALEFLDLTNAYLERQLQSRWTQLIKKDITVRNVIRLYNAAIRYNAKELEEYCFQFSVNHLTAVVRRPSFSKLDELTKESFTIKAANAGTPKTPVKSCQNFKTNTRYLMKWKIIRSLEPKFISKIHMVFVYGSTGYAALIVTKDGRVYGLGYNKFGRLGTGDTCSTLCPTEVKALSGKSIKTFVDAESQTLALTEKGEVYSWGCPYGNINAYEPTSQDLTPTLVEGYPSEAFFVDVACGQYHSLALTNDGKVYAWDKNRKSIGFNRSIEIVRGMVGVILPGKKILQIRCCSGSSMAVTDTGEVYSWGRNRLGELGRGDYIEASGVHKVQIPIGVVIEKLACGKSHTLALSTEGVLYVWGDNTFGQLGLGHFNSACTPVKLQVREMGRVLDVAASPSDNISAAMCEHNRVFVWGDWKVQQLLVPTCTSFECFHDAFAHLTLYTLMHQPLIVYSEEEMSITDHLRQAFDDIATSDLTIRVGGKPIHVHKAILRIRSQYFRTLFQKHNSQSVIEHEQFCYNVYKAYLEYLYTDHIYLPAENIHELLDLAVTYSDSLLRDRCIPLSKSEIKVDNVASIYRISVKHDLKELEQVCFNFAVDNLTTIVQTPDLCKLDEVAMKSLIIKVAKACGFKR